MIVDSRACGKKLRKRSKVVKAGRHVCCKKCADKICCPPSQYVFKANRSLVCGELLTNKEAEELDCERDGKGTA